jgi:hypothetical protein
VRRFNQEVNVTREKQKVQNFSIDIAQTLQLSLSGQRFGYLCKMVSNIRLLGNLIKRPLETIGFNLDVCQE